MNIEKVIRLTITKEEREVLKKAEKFQKRFVTLLAMIVKSVLCIIFVLMIFVNLLPTPWYINILMLYPWKINK